MSKCSIALMHVLKADIHQYTTEGIQMKSILCALSLATLAPAVFGSTALAADPPNSGNDTDAMQPFALSCSTGSSSIFPGGYIANKTCNGRSVSGIGTVSSAANTNAINFGQVGASGGRYCTTTANSIRTFSGGYVANFSCSGYAISGTGSSATDTGVNALAGC
jgi:hypothetical protein